MESHMQRMRGFWCGGLLILVLAAVYAVNAQALSFLDWFDDVAHDNSLVEGEVIRVSLRSASPYMLFETRGDSRGDFFLWGDDDIDGKMVRVLHCILLPATQVVTVATPSVPRESELGRVDRLSSGHRILHF